MIYDRFPFGKYKGFDLADIPTNYLCYAIEEFDLPVELTNQIKVIICLRLGLQEEHRPDAIKAAYKKMALKYHPDTGGDKASFQAIQEFYETLQS